MRSDVICDYPLTELLAFHKEHGSEGTILVTQVRAAGFLACCSSTAPLLDSS